MRKATAVSLLAGAMLVSSADVSAQLTIRDDVNRPLIIRTAAKRIVTLSPSLTELVFAAGAGDLVVGVDALSDYPPEAKKIAQVATGAQFSVDILAALKPDLVLAWREGIKREDIDRMTQHGTTVFVAQARSLADIPRLLEVIGRMTGRDASSVITDFEARLEKVKRANASKVRMTAFLEIWNRPLTTISGNHFLSEALEICRADNVFRELGGSAPKVSWDQLASEDPYVIVGAGSANNATEFRTNWAIRQSLSAVRAERLIYLDSDAIQRPTPRTPEGIEELCETLDKVRYAGTNRTAGAAAAGDAAFSSDRTAPFPVRSSSDPLAMPRTGGLFSAPPAAGATPQKAAPEATAPQKPAPSVAAPPAAAPATATAPPPTAEAPRRPSQYGM